MLATLEKTIKSFPCAFAGGRAAIVFGLSIQYSQYNSGVEVENRIEPARACISIRAGPTARRAEGGAGAGAVARSGDARNCDVRQERRWNDDDD